MFKQARLACTPKMETTTQQSKIDDEYADDDLGVDLSQQEEEEGDKDPEAFVGSRGSQYGGESTLLYDQFQLHSSQKKNHQLLLLKVRFAVSIANSLPFCRIVCSG